MNQHSITPAEAARALAEVTARQRQVTQLVSPMPNWLAPVSSLLIFLRFATMDLPWRAASFAGLLLALSLPVLGLIALRSRRVVLRQQPWGAAGWWSVLGVMTLVFSVWMLADTFLIPWDAAWSNTASGAMGAVLVGAALLGLNWWLTRLSRRNAAA